MPINNVTRGLHLYSPPDAPAMDIPTYEAFFAGMDELGRHLNMSVPVVFDPEFGFDPYRYSYDKLRGTPAEIMWWLTCSSSRLIGHKGPPDHRVWWKLVTRFTSLTAIRVWLPKRQTG